MRETKLPNSQIKFQSYLLNIDIITGLILVIMLRIGFLFKYSFEHSHVRFPDSAQMDGYMTILLSIIIRWFIWDLNNQILNIDLSDVFCI